MFTTFPTDQNFQPIHAPILRDIVMTGLSYTPDTTHSAIIGADVTVTIGANSIDLLQNATLLLIAGVTYGFSADTAIGIS